MFDPHSGLFEDLADGDKVIRADGRNVDLSTGDRGGDQQSGCLDPIGDHAMASCSEPFDALDLDSGSSQALDAGSHLVEAVSEIHHLRFTGRCLDHRPSLGQRGGGHDVAGAGDRAAERSSQEHRVSSQAFGFGDHVPLLNADIGSQRCEALQVQVDWSMTDVASAGQGDAGAAAAGQQGTQNTDTGSHAADQVIVGDVRSGGLHDQFQLVLCREFGVDTERTEQAQQGMDIVQVGDGRELQWAVGGEYRGHDRQGGILGAADFGRPGQRLATLDEELVHPWTLSFCGGQFGR